MKNLHYNSAEQKDLVIESVSKELVYSSMPELLGALNKANSLHEKCCISVAVTFSNATIDVNLRNIKAENATIAFTTTPVIK